MNNIIKVYFKENVDIDFIRQYTSMINEKFPNDIVLAIPQSMVSDVIFTISIPNERSEYPF